MRKKPVQLLISEGNPGRLSKKTIQERSESEIHFGDHTFVASASIRGNKIAYEEWQRITKMIVEGNVLFITSADSTLLEMRCETFADLENLKVVRAGMIEFLTFSKEQQRINREINSLRRLLMALDKDLMLNAAGRVYHAAKMQKKPAENTVNKNMFGD